MKLINIALSVAPLLAASIQDDYGTCLPGRTSCDYRDPRYMLFCEGGKYARYKCEEEGTKCVLKGSSYFRFARCE